jgi:hypothetical protein
MSKSTYKLKLKLIADILAIEDEKMLKLIYADIHAAHAKPRKAKNKDKGKDKDKKSQVDSAVELQDSTSKEPDNAYAPWTAADDQRLLELHRDGHSVKDLAATFARKQGSIETRLRKLSSRE